MLTVLYVLVLLSPILILVMANMLRELPRASRRKPEAVAAPPPAGHRTRHQAFKGTRVALEAQYLVAPRIALREAEEALRELAPERARVDLARFATISDSRLQFEALMLAIESAERAAPVVHRSRQ